MIEFPEAARKLGKLNSEYFILKENEKEKWLGKKFKNMLLLCKLKEKFFQVMSKGSSRG